jgi:hypothetical protein
LITIGIVLFATAAVVIKNPSFFGARLPTLCIALDRRWRGP